MKHFNKILFVLLFLGCCSTVNAQSDLLSSNTVKAPEDVVALYSSDDKISFGDFKPNQTYGNTSVLVKCTSPVTVQVKFFDTEGELAKQVSHSIDKGQSELNLELNDLETGTYMVQFYSKDGSAVRRFVKESKSSYTSFNSEN